ncbi:nuclear autoantigenic sperm protein [Python bivittatus]|uniref:Nuclear autoantigenic sperm protein n=1 Tax=Python bivittatus TaxID=176946 RepID=A0A9F2WIX7_PYTBI|nr:nuclear autoantigenic sperm protein [Python bivittatus]XP_025030635.1 nuclear autoantigenic sperm protein [Python bivittatus]
MTEEGSAPSTSADKTESIDVDGEAKRLLGLGQKNLVMGDIPSAVNAFQEAASLLGKKYGETANECAEAFFFYGKSLLELARMENGVLGNALEGVQVEEEEEKTEDSMVESADNIDEEAREELREQVYNAMGENESRKTSEDSLVETRVPVKNKDAEMEEVREEKAAVNIEDNSFGEKESTTKQVEGVQEKQVSEITVEDSLEDSAAAEEKPEEIAGGKKPAVAEAAQEDIALKKALVVDKAPGEEKLIVEEAAEAAGGETIQKQAAAEEKLDLQKVEEKAEKLVVMAGEKHTDAKLENSIVETLAKTSGEILEEKQLVSAVDKVEWQAEQTATAIVEETDIIAGQETLDLKEEKLKEPVASGEVLPTAPNEITSGDVEQSCEIEIEEKAEAAAKVEKEEEKDHEMGEGEETEGSEEEDKTEEDKENYSTAEEKESEEDEVGNLELAWDMLELAKVIYKRQDTKEAQLHAAQAHLKLGEVSIESENYMQAIEEFHSCLALQQKYLEAHDRLLAETHYHLGLAYHYNNQYEEAVLQFSKSMEVIDKRMVMLTERLKAKGEGPAEDEKEIEELKGLLPEIKEKIEDSKESQNSASVTELALKATLVGGSSSFSQGCESSATSTIPVGHTTDGATDISHLVRKKRKPEEETQQGDNEAKKSKSEPAVNGGGDAAPRGNEVGEKMEQETGGRPQVETVQSTV